MITPWSQPDDGVVGGLHDGSETAALLVGALLRRDVAEDAQVKPRQDVRDGAEVEVALLPVRAYEHELTFHAPVTAERRPSLVEVERQFREFGDAPAEKSFARELPELTCRRVCLQVDSAIVRKEHGVEGSVEDGAKHAFVFAELILRPAKQDQR